MQPLNVYQENQILRSKLEHMRIEMARMSNEIKQLKTSNADLTQRVQFLEQGYVNRTELDAFVATVQNSFEYVKSRTDALFSMISETSSKIADPSLHDSIIGYGSMFDSTSDSFEVDSFDGIFEENPLGDYVVNEINSQVETQEKNEKTCSRNNNYMSHRSRPELSESTEIVSLNF